MKTPDSPLKTAARALSAFDPLTALKHVALRSDAPALALRGIAMAQLGEFTLSRKLLRRAARAFGDEHPTGRARCIAAEAEVALACRDLEAAGHGLRTAVTALTACGDVENARFSRLQLVRCSLFLGQLAEARRALGALDLERAPARTVALAALVEADLAVRSVRPDDARAAFDRARAAARKTGSPSLEAEVERGSAALAAPVARLCVSGSERTVALDEVAAIFRTRAFVVDACRREVRAGNVTVPLVARPVLFALAQTLGENAPQGAPRKLLVLRAFGGKTPNESLRARLRVEIGRLRTLLASIADVRATEQGFALAPRRGSEVLVLLPPEPGEASALVALLASGESWSTSALASALGKSQRAVQRALGTLLEEKRVQAIGRGRSRRWAAPTSNAFATTLLLLARDAAL